MGVFEQFPWSNFHEMNQDWLLREMKQLIQAFAQVQEGFTDLRTWVINWFKNLDIDEEIMDAIMEKVDEMERDGTIKRMISQAIAEELPKYSAPVFVSSTSAMTDNQRVYVLTGNGHIYAWNGTQFFDTGLIYNLDASDWISNLGALADETDLDDVDAADGFYYISSSSSYGHLPPNVAAGLLLVTKQGITTTQLLTGVNGNQLTRHKTGEAAWTAWTQTGMGNNGVVANNMDLNSITQPGYWLLNGDYTYTNGPAWLVSGAGGLLYVGSSGTYVQQVATRSNGQASIRRSSAGSWSTWVALSAGNNGMLPYSTDLNDLIYDGYWFLNGVTEANYGHMPDAIPSGRAGWLTIKHYNNLICQWLDDLNGVTCFRRSLNAGIAWGDWILASVKDSSEGVAGKYIAFGDSLMWGSVWKEVDGEVTIQRADLANQMPTRIARACGLMDNFVNAAVGNMAYVAYTGYPLEQTMGQKIAATDLTGVTLVTLGGGRNDTTNFLSDIRAAIEDIIEDIQTRAPKAQIVLTAPTPHSQSNGSIAFTEEGAGEWSLDDFDAMGAQLAAAWGIGYVGWRECTYMWHWSSFTGAGGNYAHPDNQESYAVMGAYLGGKVSQYFKW